MDKYILIYIFVVNTYILYTETSKPNTNKHVHAHKCLLCAGNAPATSCVVGENSHHYAKSAAIHFQFDISTNAFEIRTVQSPKCKADAMLTIRKLYIK
jgi:hypothetical protein